MPLEILGIVGAALIAFGTLCCGGAEAIKRRYNVRCRDIDQHGALNGVARSCQLPRGHYGLHRNGVHHWASFDWRVYGK